MQLPDFKLKIGQIFNQDWWVKIETRAPACTYYFGPFYQRSEAQASQIGYLDDLAEEGAKGITVKIERGCPQELTVYEEHEKLHQDGLR